MIQTHTVCRQRKNRGKIRQLIPAHSHYERICTSTFLGTRPLYRHPRRSQTKPAPSASSTVKPPFSKMTAAGVSSAATRPTNTPTIRTTSASSALPKSPEPTRESPPCSHNPKAAHGSLPKTVHSKPSPTGNLRTDPSDGIPKPPNTKGNPQ